MSISDQITFPTSSIFLHDHPFFFRQKNLIFEILKIYGLNLIGNCFYLFGKQDDEKSKRKNWENFLFEIVGLNFG